MKEKIMSVLIGLVLVICFTTPLAFLMGIGANMDKTMTMLHIRTEKVQVIEINNSKITVVDNLGQEWEFTGHRDYFINEVLTIKFDTLGTQDIKDDEIIRVYT